MLIYEKVVEGERKLLGTMKSAPSAEDTEVIVNPNGFDFNGKYYYSPPGGIKDEDGNEVTVFIEDNQIIPPAGIKPDEESIPVIPDEESTPVIPDEESTPVVPDEPAGEVDTTKDELSELVADDKLITIQTEESLQAMSKATIAKMAEVLGYTAVDASATKSAMIEAFLAAQAEDPRATTEG